jgi:hypothetical protein
MAICASVLGLSFLAGPASATSSLGGSGRAGHGIASQSYLALLGAYALSLLAVLYGFLRIVVLGILRLLYMS